MALRPTHLAPSWPWHPVMMPTSLGLGDPAPRKGEERVRACARASEEVEGTESCSALCRQASQVSRGATQESGLGLCGREGGARAWPVQALKQVWVWRC